MLETSRLCLSFNKVSWSPPPKSSKNLLFNSDHYLVNVTNNNGREENLREGHRHRVHRRDDRRVHEVNRVAVEEDRRASHRNTHNYGPENVFEA